MKMDIAYEVKQDSLLKSLLETLSREKEESRAASLAMEVAQAHIKLISAQMQTLEALKTVLQAIVGNPKDQQSSLPAPTMPEHSQGVQEETQAPKSSSSKAPTTKALSTLTFCDVPDRQCEICETEGHSEITEAVAQEKMNVDGISPNSSIESAVAEVSEAWHQALMSVMNNTSKEGQGQENLHKPPTRQLSADFLSKNGPAEETSIVVEASEKQEETHTYTATPAHEDAVSEPQESDNVYLIQNNVKSATQGTGASPDHILTDVAPLLALDTNIKWTIRSLLSASDDEDGLEQAKLRVLRSDHNQKYGETFASQGSYFWQYPVRFLPEPGEKNLYRTVMVDYLPQGTTYHEVLQHIRTGALESIQLFSPLQGTNKYMTARIVFTYEKPATSVVMHYQNRLCRGDPIKIEDVQVRFWQVLQPTYPANKQLEANIFQHGYTRLLLLGNMKTSSLLPPLHEKLGPELRDDTLISIGHTEDNVPMIEFTSVAAAARALRRFEEDKDFEDAVFDFERDYCEDAYESA